MPKLEHPSCHPQRIAELDPTFREKDGVVFDVDSYKRHCQTAPAASGPASPQPSPAAPARDFPATPEPQGVFLTDPVHIGWYETRTPAAYPIMGGFVAQPCGSGSGSWLSSYLTSYLTSYGSFLTSFRLTSGSFSGSCALCGGYGLELI